MSQPSPATIKVLPARLANQIAAGEVVERPASVLKELLENSIDAGATMIDIDIEKGGHKKIKITDNGTGIAKDQLMLALSRHATSKVSELDDLENIHTLGFRGEALASISSVSRLTLTSRTAEQAEAWQARSEGRDMQVVVEPAAHPQGTSVEVLDLFFNTPARRKFLRTEKTEFNHIEELFNRIALSRYDVGLRLKHNGKLLKNLPAIASEGDPLKRIKQLCGASICDGFLQVEGEYQGFHLRGWLSGPGYHRAMSDIQFVFVNNRMMRDKLIFHAIRQSFEGLLPPDKFPYFVLYLDVPCNEVDVNVHPAKHEVRFHQSRLVHDFIFSVLNEALNTAMQPKSADGSESPIAAQRKTRAEVEHNYQPATDYPQTNNPAANHSEANNPAPDNSTTNNPDTSYITPLQAVKEPQPAQHTQVRGFSASNAGYRPDSPKQLKEAASQYTRLMTVPVAAAQNTSAAATSTQVDSATGASENAATAQDADSDVLSLGDILHVAGRGLLLRWQQEYYFLSDTALCQQLLKNMLSPVTQPLLLPVSVKATDVEISSDLLSKTKDAGLELHQVGKKLILKQVPAGTREQNWQAILNHLVDSLSTANDIEVYAVFAQHWKLPPEQSSLNIWHALSDEQQQELVEQNGHQVDFSLLLKEMSR